MIIQFNKRWNTFARQVLYCTLLLYYLVKHLGFISWGEEILLMIMEIVVYDKTLVHIIQIPFSLNVTDFPYWLLNHDISLSE